MKAQKFAVIGLGEFGMQLVRQLHAAGHEVVAIDQAMDRVQMAGEFVAQAICLNASEPEALHDHELEALDAIILAIKDFESLIAAADALRSLPAKHIIARYQTPLELKILQMLGIESTVNLEENAARSITGRLTYRGLQTSIPVEGEFSIIEVSVPEELVGQRVRQVDFSGEHSLSLVSVRRGAGRGKDPKPGLIGVVPADTRLRKSDSLVLFGREDDLAAFHDRFA